ncbi:MAG: hypothetical protein QOF78_1123 [Phycisphaerales bacterium]|jgi:hypothetical protein|nr:hypothetical protein [Phycisphaerales bacterium]
MRLYCKLLLMILACGALQHFAPPSAWGRDAWFMVRCHAANVLGDERLAADLVDEYYHNVRQVDENEIAEIEFEIRLAAG